VATVCEQVHEALTGTTRTGFYSSPLGISHSRSPLDLNLIAALIVALGRVVQRLLRPARCAANLAVGATTDLSRTRPDLLAENALLRQQVIVLRRRIERPRLHRDDRLLLLVLARLTRRWRDVLHVVSPETLLRWHRDLFKIVWTRKSRPQQRPKRLSPEVVSLTQAMAKDNLLWGAERIRGELLKLGIRVSKRMIQKYMRDVRPHQGLRQRIPRYKASQSVSESGREVVALPILGGLHHHYQWAA